MRSTREWLSAIGLTQYVEAFDANDISIDLLPSLSDQDLRDIGVQSLGHRKLLLKAIKSLVLNHATPVTSITPEAGQSSAAQRRQLTVMFCDVVGSTELSGRLDPEEFREVIRRYQATCAQEIARYDGHIAQYLGDGLLIYFGHPTAHEDDAQRAVHAGLDVISALRKRNTEAPATHQVSVRIGIHTGLVVVGEIGGGDRQETLALGETPNVAARLQSLAAPDSMVISAATQRLVARVFAFRTLGHQALKGVAGPLTCYQVMGAAAASSAAVESATPLVGRNQEIGLLMDRWEQAIDGSGQAVLLTGEPGIGKSRLLAAMRVHIAEQPHSRLELRGSSYYQHSPLYPIAEALPRTMGWRVDDSQEAKLQALENLCEQNALGAQSVGLMAALLSLGPNTRHTLPPMSADRQKQLTFEVLLAWILARSAQHPLFLVVEDLHWMDHSTLEWLAQLLDQLPTFKILLMLTTRPTFNPSWQARTHLSTLTLGRFTKRQATAMIDHVTRHKMLPEEVLEQILIKTDGVPLFVEELTKMVIESDLVRETDDTYELTGPLKPLAIPSTLQDSLMARLDRLAHAKDIAQLGATLGRVFPYALLRAVCTVDDAALERALVTLVNSEILHRKGFASEATYIFRHALIQDAAYQSLLKSTRQQFHLRIARTLCDQLREEASNQPEFVAHHFTEGGAIVDALPWWQRAGERAYARGATAEAIRHYRLGLHIVAGAPPSLTLDKAQLSMWIALGNALIHAQGWSTPDTAQAFKEAERLSDRIGDPLTHFRVTFANWATNFIGGDLRRTLPYARRSLQLANELNDGDLQINAHAAMGHTLTASGAFIEGMQHIEQSLALYGPDLRRDLLMRFGRDPKVSATQAMIQSLCHMGYLDQAAQKARENLDFSKALGHPFMVVWGYYSLGFVQMFGMATDHVDATALGLALAEDQHFPSWIGWITATVGASRIEAGELDEGISGFERGVAVMHAIGARLYEPLLVSFLAKAYRLRGDLDIAARINAEALVLADALGQFNALPPLACEEGLLWLARSAPDVIKAETSFLRAIEIARTQQARYFELQACVHLARLWQSQGKLMEARDMLTPVLAWFSEGLDTRLLKEATELVRELSSPPVVNGSN